MLRFYGDGAWTTKEPRPGNTAKITLNRSKILTKIKQDMGAQPEELPPLDSRALAVDVNYEVRRTLVDLIRDDPPTTILGVIVSHPAGVAVEDIAKRLQQPFGLVDWNVEKLEDDDLCVRIAEGGIKKVLPFAAYTERNGQL